jgi:transcriptional regulator
MIISNFTTRELEHLRTQCNFVGYETDVFELRSKGIPLEEIAEIVNMTVDGIKKISRKVNSKISRELSVH